MASDSDNEARIKMNRSAAEDLDRVDEHAVTARLHDIALQLRMQNSRRPVAMLLPELLAEIFYHYVAMV